MFTVILNQNSASESSLNKTIEAIRSLGAKEILLIGSLNSAPEGVSLVASDESASGAKLLKAISRASGNKLIIIDAAAELSQEALAQTLEATNSNEVVLAGSNDELGDISVSSLSGELMVRTVANASEWPLSALAASKKLFESLLATSMESASAVLVSAIAQATADGLSVATITAGATTSLSNEEKSQVLEHVVNNFNIEELFPNHAWQSHGEESAAACYHTLAAMFLKLNNIDSALECLAFSDRLEDSPRSLALKALIAAEKGETLGAVANMVSSLQEYEKRKIETETHYLNFVPSDLNTINENLNAGLEALNKRDNETALEHFSNAVFSFDSFYKETGVSEKIN